MKARLNVPTLVTVLVVGLILAGFAGSAYADKELKIGFLAPLSGPVAFAGRTMLNSATIAAEEINAAGGITAAGERYKIKLVSYDTKYAAAPARAAAERLIFEDKVHFILGATSLDTLGFRAITEKNKVMILPVGGAIKASPKNPYTFRVSTTVESKYVGLYTYIKENMPGFRKVASINPDTPVGESYSKMSHDGAKPLGFTIVASEFVATGSSDFSPTITRVLDRQPDIIDLGGTGGGRDSALIIKQAHELGYKKQIVCAVGLQSKTVKEVVGTQAMEGIIETGFDSDDPAVSPTFRVFAKKYTKTYPKLPFIDLTAEFYDTVLNFFRFLDGQKTLDTEVLKDLYANYCWKGIYGKSCFGGEITYGIKRQKTNPAYLSRWKNGKPVIFTTIAAPVP